MSKFTYTFFDLIKIKLIYFLFGFLLISCGDDGNSNDPEANGTTITSFTFLPSENPSIGTSEGMEIEDDKIIGTLPVYADMENLVARFEHTGAEVIVNNFPQQSGKTANDFTKTLNYTVKSKNGETRVYEVNLDRFTGLPIVYINTLGSQAIDSKDDYREGSIQIDGNKNFANLGNSEMKIRGRGNSTWWVHPKKPYQLNFSDKTEMLGMPKDKKWIFLAEYSDKTLLRNRIAFELGHMSKLDWTPQSAFAEVMVNNEYMGTYHISQKVEEGDFRVALGDDGYLLEIDQLDRLDPDDVYFRTNSFLINIKEPSLDYESTAYTYIKDYINDFENTLFSNNFKDPIHGYQKYVNLDSFIDWYLISEISKNQDSKDFSSIFLNVMPGEKIKMGPLWDFDLAFGNVDYSDATKPTGFWVKDHKWYSRLFEDPAFVELVKERFKYFRQNESLILQKIDDQANYLKWAQEENDKKWNLFGNYVWPNPVVFDTYQEEVDHLKSWYKERMNWLEGAFNSL
ncbi:CotH kinase family protein [Namhaeicola litoreus]|uniref:CotH kinase family protein n=1 Tax=Namhaeicola litoreus TaxID=1052145 RepID=A0ABW3XY19_9FLAO